MSIEALGKCNFSIGGGNEIKECDVMEISFYKYKKENKQILITEAPEKLQKNK